MALVEGLPASRCRLHMETKGFDDYTADLTLTAGQTLTLAAQLEPVEELAFERLSSEQTQKFILACSQSEFREVEFKESNFDDEEQWAALWSKLNLTAPPVDFSK